MFPPSWCLLSVPYFYLSPPLPLSPPSVKVVPSYSPAKGSIGQDNGGRGDHGGSGESRFKGGRPGRPEAALSDMTDNLEGYYRKQTKTTCCCFQDLCTKVVMRVRRGYERE